MSKLTQIHGEPSYELSSDCVSAHITQRGGHMAPVAFKLLNGEEVFPYALAPWEPKEFPCEPPLLQILRGDFFCFPFGVTDGIDLPHGESANNMWELHADVKSTITLKMNMQQPVGRISRKISLRDGQRALYQEHRIEGVSGRYNFGHHPILEFPEGVYCPVRVSPFRLGQVYPGQFASDPTVEKTSLMPGATFTTLESIPLKAGGMASLAEYPALNGSEDLLMVSADAGVRIGWTAVSFPGYVWLSLRDTRSFPSTVFWISNGGRQQPPWNGRHKRRLGIEDVCSHFHDGCHISSRDLLADQGIPTSREFSPDSPTTLRHIQMVVPVQDQPPVSRIEFDESHPNQIFVHFENAPPVNASADWTWLLS